MTYKRDDHKTNVEIKIELFWHVESNLEIFMSKSSMGRFYNGMCVPSANLLFGKILVLNLGKI